METLKKIVSNQYFPAAAVLAGVVLFWTIALFGGLSLLNNNQPPMATLTWMLFVYAAAVLTPLAGFLAAVNLVRRWMRNREYAQYLAATAAPEEPAAAVQQPVAEPLTEQLAAPEPQPQPALNHQPAQAQPVKHHPGQKQPMKKQSAQSKQRKKAA